MCLRHVSYMYHCLIVIGQGMQLLTFDWCIKCNRLKSACGRNVWSFGLWIWLADTKVDIYNTNVMIDCNIAIKLDVPLTNKWHPLGVSVQLHYREQKFRGHTNGNLLASRREYSQWMRRMAVINESPEIINGGETSREFSNVCGVNYLFCFLY